MGFLKFGPESNDERLMAFRGEPIDLHRIEPDTLDFTADPALDEHVEQRLAEVLSMDFSNDDDDFTQEVLDEEDDAAERVGAGYVEFERWATALSNGDDDDLDVDDPYGLRDGSLESDEALLAIIENGS